MFSFSGLPSGVDKVRITFIGTKTSGLGLAFNNFSPDTAAVLEPTTMALAILGAAFLSCWPTIRPRRPRLQNNACPRISAAKAR